MELRHAESRLVNQAGVHAPRHGRADMVVHELTVPRANCHGAAVASAADLPRNRRTLTAGESAACTAPPSTEVTLPPPLCRRCE